MQESSFLTLKSWVANTDIKKFEILLCIGNKADLVPGHHAHTEYRRRKQKHRESSSDPHTEYFDYGIDETEGFSLLRDEEPSIEIRKSSLEWCVENNIEYIEACAANADFDKCKFLSSIFSFSFACITKFSDVLWNAVFYISKTLKLENLLYLP